MIHIWIVSALVAGSLIVGTFAGWMLCALITMGVDREQRTRIWRLMQAVAGFVKATEQYHDDQALANLRTYARDLLERRD